ncbi:Alpha/Beta hydrolase protein [Ochromonadaceae sp. CCMP2298]|nr:Alpha/Beta hydrolase protein [Ochromonadaceae sp. CCMP2298]KAJ1439340.1 Alpha/Beta hydrolase protein [Ochromonadaceae sp. CCMP2298]|mmetsp:Transcript_11537/g.25641  ORF Transcript_11537/g.25641 Transcript_11537/m.25641 type:complete len:346 (-) Transcript_11537:7-1044(-)
MFRMQGIARLSASQHASISQRAFSILSTETYRGLQAPTHDAHATPAAPTAVFMHGILGSKKNWRTPSKIFVKKHPTFRAIAVDQRGHGASPNLPGDNTVRSCVLDVIKTLDVAAGLSATGTATGTGTGTGTSGSGQAHYSTSAAAHVAPTLLLAHSFSGKVALSYLQQQQGLSTPQHVWILDSLPGPYDVQHDLKDPQSVIGILKHIRSLPREFESKLWVEQTLAAKGVAKPVIQWVSTNIVQMQDSPTLRYSFDIDTVLQLFDDFCALDMWSFLESYQGPTQIHFIRAGKNNAWTPQVLDRFGAITSSNSGIVLHTMPHVGHWLHAEDANGMLDIISKHSGLTP